MNWFVRWGYRKCACYTILNWWWAKLWYRYYCPYPIISDPSAKACVRSGYCGCNNKKRYHQAP